MKIARVWSFQHVKKSYDRFDWLNFSYQKIQSDVSTKAGNFRRIFDLKQSINWEFYKPMLQPNIQYLIIFCLPSGNIHSAHYAKHVSFVELQVQTSCFAAPLQGCLPFRPE